MISDAGFDLIAVRWSFAIDEIQFALGHLVTFGKLGEVLGHSSATNAVFFAPLPNAFEVFEELRPDPHTHPFLEPSFRHIPIPPIQLNLLHCRLIAQHQVRKTVQFLCWIIRVEEAIARLNKFVPFELPLQVGDL